MGAVYINGKRARASASVHVGDVLRVEYASRTLEVEIVGEIGHNVSRAVAPTLYRVLRDERSS